MLSITFILACGGVKIEAQNDPPVSAWIVEDTQRVLRDELPPSNALQEVKMFAARNEWESFQILFRSSTPLTIDNIRISGLSHTADLSHAIRIYRQHQMLRTQLNANEPNIPHVGENEDGWYPDALIPARHPETRQPLNPTGAVQYKAFPFSLPANETHGYLVDIHVPAGTAAGVYTGTCLVDVSGTPGVYSFPIELEVFNFKLPEVSTLKVPIGFTERQMRALDAGRLKRLTALEVPGNETQLQQYKTKYYRFEEDNYRYDLNDSGYWETIVKQMNELASRHNIRADYPNYAFWFDETVPADWKFGINHLNPSVSLADSSDAGKLNYLANFITQYEVNMVEVPFVGTKSVAEIIGAQRDNNKYFLSETLAEEFINYFNSSYSVKSETLQKLENYLTSWDTNIIDAVDNKVSHQVTYYIYLYDEPLNPVDHPEYYRYVDLVGRFIKSLNLKHLKVLVVGADYKGFVSAAAAKSAVDIWCPSFSQYDEMFAEPTGKHSGDGLWTYTAQIHNNHPMWLLDTGLVDYRVPAWLAWRYNISGLLYWSAALWRAPDDDPASGNWAELNDPWSNPVSYRSFWNGKFTYYNGEGVLLYPAYVKTVGYKGVVPSLRLKALRDAIEDYEYLVYAAAQHSSLKNEILNGIVMPLSSSWVDWRKDPAEYELARRKLAATILNGKVVDFGDTPIPGKVEAEEYGDYANTAVANIENTPEGTQVTFNSLGDWLEYSLDVTKTGNYSIEFEVRGLATKSRFLVEQYEAGSSAPVVHESPEIGQSGAYTRVTIDNVPFTAGKMKLRIRLQEGAAALNWFDVRATSLDAPVARWIFLRNAHDASGNNHHGLVSGAQLTVGREGLEQSAYQFNGTSSVIDAGSASTLDVGSTDLTVTAWIQPPAAPVAGRITGIVSKKQSDAEGDRGYALLYETDASASNWRLLFHSGNGASTSIARSHWVPVQPSGTWHFVAASLIRAQGCALYVDGADQTEFGGTGLPQSEPVTSSAPFLIGRSAALDSYFQGKIDDVYLFKTALPADAIHDIRLRQEPVVEWNFDGDASDALGNFNGTAVGTTLAADRHGEKNSAYQFDGTTSVLKRVSDPLLDLGTSDVTVTAWIQPTSIPSTGFGGILSKGKVSSGVASGSPAEIVRESSGYTFVYQASQVNGWRLLFWIADGLAREYSQTDWMPFPAANEWYFVAASVDVTQTSSVKLYVNGTDKTNWVSNGFIEFMTTKDTGNEAPLTVGAWAGSNFFPGIIDDVRLYKTALTEAQLAEIATPSAPEIALTYAGQEVLSGSLVDAGSTSVGTAKTLTFTIANTGLEALALAETPKVQLSGAHSADFTVTQSLPSIVLPGESFSFTVDFTPQGEGARTAQMSIANNDSDEQPYLITLTGTGNAVAGPAMYHSRTGTVINKDRTTIWHPITFAENFGVVPVFVADIQTHWGGEPAELRMQNLTGSGVEIKLEEDKSLDNENNHMAEDVGYWALRPGVILNAAGEAIGEASSLLAKTSADSDWDSLTFQRSYTNPVVRMQIVTFGGTAPVHVRLRNVNAGGLEFQLEEWDHDDQFHGWETVNYVVLEAGDHALPNNTRVLANTVNLSADGSRLFTKVLFSPVFADVPVVLSQSQTYNDPAAIVIRQRDTLTNRVKLRLVEEEAADQVHGSETVGYIAIGSQTAGVQTGGDQTVPGTSPDVIEPKPGEVPILPELPGEVTTVPEPSTMMLLLPALLGVAAMWRNRR